MITTVTTARVLPPEFSTELEKLAARPQQQLAVMHDFVSRPEASAWTADAITRILADRNYLEELAAKSLAHPNGFDSMPIEVRLPHYRVRLHVWWPETPTVTEDVHNHAWSFASRVLSGAMNFTTYRRSDDGSAFFHYPWRYGDQGTYDGNNVETVKLATTFEGCFTTNTHYRFDLQELHRVAPVKTGRPLATLALTGKLQRKGSDVYTEQPRHDEGFRLAAERFTAPQLTERLSRLLEFL